MQGNADKSRRPPSSLPNVAQGADGRTTQTRVSAQHRRATQTQARQARHGRGRARCADSGERAAQAALTDANHLTVDCDHRRARGRRAHHTDAGTTQTRARGRRAHHTDERTTQTRARGRRAHHTDAGERAAHAALTNTDHFTVDCDHRRLPPLVTLGHEPPAAHALRRRLPVTLGAALLRGRGRQLGERAPLPRP